jgi:broad specificity phosphatase PhoE
MAPEDEKIVYFVRHGQSTGNVTPVFQTLDSALNEKGKLQAAKIAERVSKLSFETLISSPLARTKETAETIAQATGKQIEFSKLFVERVKPTRLEGKRYDDQEADELWKQWELSLYTPGVKIEDGESYDDLVIRADKALEFLHARPERSLVVVTHGFFLCTIMARVLLTDSLTGDAFRNFQAHSQTENTGLSVIKYGPRYEGTFWRLWVYNDYAHLG